MMMKMTTKGQAGKMEILEKLMTTQIHRHAHIRHSTPHAQSVHTGIKNGDQMIVFEKK